MRAMTVAAAACCALAATAFAASPLEQLKGKMKEGMYETRMDMDMGSVPGMPPGMGKQSFTHQHCVQNKDIENGGFSKGRDGKARSEKCEIKDFKMSGNTATYTTVCTDPKMTADNRVTFSNDGYKMDMKMAMDQGGRMMNMNQHMESRYLGPCK